MTISTKNWSLEKSLPWLMVIGGFIGLLASAILFQDHLDLLKNPHYVPVCNLNPIFSCSSVASSDQASAFGIYNGFLGLPGYAAIMTIGLVLLAGAKFKRWLWRIINTGLLLAIGFVTWLQYETLYRIGALCIFCMVIWAVTIPLFLYTTIYNLKAGNLPVPKKLKPAAVFIQRHHGDILLLWFLIIIALILHRFWYYWKTLI